LSDEGSERPIAIADVNHSDDSSSAAGARSDIDAASMHSASSNSDVVIPVVADEVDGPPAWWERLVAQVDAEPIPKEFMGVSFSLRGSFRPTHGPPYLRREVRCHNIAHVKCGRRRNCTLNKHFGQLEVYGFLALWLRAANHPVHGASKAAHGRYTPSIDEIKEFLGSEGLL
jgi:hypothetical protein